MNHQIANSGEVVCFICKTVSVLIITLVIILPLTLSQLSTAQSPTKTEIEAVFIYKFLNFIEWPETGDTDSFTICTIGNSDMNSAINMIEQKDHKGMKIKLRKKVQENDINNCRVIFFGEVDNNYFKNTINFSTENSILTIGDKNGFIESGGMINFIFDDNRVNFEINQKNADRAGLKISSKLLRLAKKVIKKEQ